MANLRHVRLWVEPSLTLQDAATYKMSLELPRRIVCACARNEKGCRTFNDELLNLKNGPYFSMTLYHIYLIAVVHKSLCIRYKSIRANFINTFTQHNGVKVFLSLFLLQPVTLTVEKSHAFCK
jgi:hypothetical protein